MSTNKKPKKRGPKPKAKKDLKRVITCTVDQEVLRKLTAYWQTKKYGSLSECVNEILRKEVAV